MDALRIARARTPRAVGTARALVEEYVASLPPHASEDRIVRDRRTFPWPYVPPGGEILVAYAAREPVGVVALRRLEARTCEMKRLYVRPPHRGQGVARALVRRLLSDAARLGYERLRLDTLPTMTAALELYRSLGFREIPPYWNNPVRDAHFFEIGLDRRGPGAPTR